MPAKARATLGAARRTLRDSVRFVGVGLRDGRQTEVIVEPCTLRNGILFSTPAGTGAANIANTSNAPLTTSLFMFSRSGSSQHVQTVHTVEHILAALYAYRVDDAKVRVRHLTDHESDSPSNGEEVSVPILDGSSWPFADALDDNVVELENTHATRLVVQTPVRIKDGESWAELTPPEGCLRTGEFEKSDALHFDVSIDFGDRLLAGAGSRQRVAFTLNWDGVRGARAFHLGIAPARTFCLERDALAMKTHGIAKGGSLANAVVFADETGECMNEGGLRFNDEPCKHKILDCIGDLSLAAHPIIGTYRAHRPSHHVNRAIARALLGDKSTHRIVRATELQS